MKNRKIKDKTIKEQLKEFLLSSEGTISIDEAIKEAEKKWPK